MDDECLTKKKSRDAHQRCFACGRAEDGLGLDFHSSPNGRVCAECVVSDRYEGYPGVVQGGIVATVLDSAMTNCLFSKGVEAMTARLNVQYREPVLINQTMRIEAEMIEKRSRVYELEATLTQGDSLKASASGRFLVKKDDV